MIEKLYKKQRNFAIKWYQKYQKDEKDSFLKKIYKWFMRNFIPCVGWAIIFKIVMGALFGYSAGILALALVFLPFKLLNMNPIVGIFLIVGKIFLTQPYESDITGKSYDSFQEMIIDENSYEIKKAIWGTIFK